MSGPAISGSIVPMDRPKYFEELDRVAVPRYAGPEVTHDPFFCGGRLCVATADELAHALASAPL
jgi:hypothetical protein